MSWELAAIAFIADGAFSRFLDPSVITAPISFVTVGVGAGAVLDATGSTFYTQTIASSPRSKPNAAPCADALAAVLAPSQCIDAWIFTPSG